MAVCAKNILKTSFNLLNKRVFKQLTFNAQRQLYSQENLGVSGYLNARDYVKTRFYGVDDIFYQKMQKVVENEKSMVFTEDLKTMIHLIEKKPEHLDLLYKMLKVFNTHNNLRFKSYVFGPVIMRALYYLDEPDFALQALQDPDLQVLFDQVTSYTIVMDMLYNHNKFKQVREVYDTLQSKNINSTVHPKNPLILTMGACYRENSEESFQYALDLFKQLQDRGFNFPRRAISFIAALAIKQNNPEVSLEVLSFDRNITYIDHRCLKLEAYTMLNRIDEIIVILSHSLHTDFISNRKQKFFSDTIENIETFLKSKKSDEYDKISNIVKQLRLHDFVETNTLFEHITTPIKQIQLNNHYQRNVHSNQDRRYNPRFNRNSNYGNGRPGLRDVLTEENR